MAKQNIQIDFNNCKEPKETFLLYEKIIEDRGSKYSVSFGRVESKDEIKNFLKTLKQDKKYAKATHNTWAVRISHDGANTQYMGCAHFT
jgi:putative IMPACT (imprinted ancient) family translation regulator